MGNVRMRAEQINYGASNVKVALDDLDPKDLIALSARMDMIDVWKATVKTEEKTGASVEYANALALNAVSVSADIVATQDLHGYDKPWVGGAGRNKYPILIGNDASNTNDGATASTDADGNLLIATSDSGSSSGVYYTNTSSLKSTSAGMGGANISFDVISDVPCTVSIGTGNAGDPTRKSIDVTTAKQRVYYNDYTGSDAFVIYVSRTAANITISNMMLTVTSDTDTSYEPYENICPISGLSSVVITNVDSESQTATVTVSLSSTVYGGTLNLTTGELTVTHGFIMLDGTQEVIIANWKPKANSIGWLYRYNLTNAKVLGGDEVGDIISNALSADTYNHLFNDDVTGITCYTDKSYGLVVRVADTSLTTSALINAYLASNPIQVCYELATPTTTTLTAEQVALVAGYNRLSANTGNITVEAYTGAPWGGDEV